MYEFCIAIIIKKTAFITTQRGSIRSGIAPQSTNVDKNEDTAGLHYFVAVVIGLLPLMCSNSAFMITISSSVTFTGQWFESLNYDFDVVVVNVLMLSLLRIINCTRR